MKMNLRFYGVAFSLLVGAFAVVHYAELALQPDAFPFSVQADRHLPPSSQPPQLTLQHHWGGPETIDLGMPERRVSAASR